ncbi:DUF5681 domain-containing protein [Novosphingobium sp.]|uniref:DUF5681 domain-containing protein n=1 Tax=Novosphingobium sp. TaxID=1874826 RepID=UPI003D09B17E
MTKKSPPNDSSKNPDAPANTIVGPRNPPVEYRWKKGDPSPNPRGRPKKKHLKSLLAGLNPLAAALLENGRRVVGEIQGEEITNIDAVMRSLSKRALKETPAARLFTQLMEKAQADEQEVNHGILLAAMEHKEAYGPKFAHCEKLGLKLPNVLPHPEDIIIEPDGSVKIVGPVMWEGQIILEATVKARDMWIDVGKELARAEARIIDEADAHDHWKKARRKFYRLNAHIPPRLKKSFPRFKY